MKKFFAIAIALPLAFALPASGQNTKPKAYKAPSQITLPEGIDPEMVKEAGNRAVKNLLSEFMGQRDLTLRRFAVLPLDSDVDGCYFTDKVRDQFALMGKPSGFELYTRTDEDWNKLMQEIAFGQRVEDTMSPETVQKFGRIAGVQGLIMGRVVSVTRDINDVKIRFSLRAFEVETGRLLWGNEITEYGEKPANQRTLLDQLDRRDLPRYGLIGAGILVGLVAMAKIGKAMGRAARPR